MKCHVTASKKAWQIQLLYFTFTWDDYYRAVLHFGGEIPTLDVNNLNPCWICSTGSKIKRMGICIFVYILCHHQNKLYQNWFYKLSWFCHGMSFLCIYCVVWQFHKGNVSPPTYIHQYIFMKNWKTRLTFIESILESKLNP